jgi:hypothetical protein
MHSSSRRGAGHETRIKGTGAEERDHLEDLGVDGRILNIICNK